MDGISGEELLVDPPVARRPLPFSRAWLAAFVLALIGIGWAGAVERFDDREVEADLDDLVDVVSELEAIDPTAEAHLVTRQFLRLETLVESPATNGDDRVERLWRRVGAISRRAFTIDASDPQAVRLIVADLQAAAAELAELIGEDQNSVSSSDSISRSPS